MGLVPIDQYTGQIWWNGQFIEWSKACVHVLTHSLHYGGAVFEGIRVYNGVAFKLYEHLQRLEASATSALLKVPFDINTLGQQINEVIRLNNIKNGYIRPVAWLGSEEMFVGATKCKTHVAIAGWPSFEQYDIEKLKQGYKMTIAKWKKIPAACMPVHSKLAASYLMYRIVQAEAREEGFDDAIMLNIDANITESSTSNFFAVVNGSLHTPSTGDFLDGITRRTIIELAKQHGIKVIEEPMKVENLKQADGAFLTGTAIEIMPITSIYDYRNGGAIYAFNPVHPLVLSLLGYYREMVNAE
ncbi:putative branched-chain-amino-acid aminotransferase [Alphaproteobacteria bacterium]